MPLLQLCQDCYKTTVDLLLDAPNQVNQDHNEVNSTRTTPRGRWNNVVTSQSPSSCGSEGSWSVGSSLRGRERTSSNLMAMYLNKLVVIQILEHSCTLCQGFLAY